MTEKLTKKKILAAGGIRFQAFGVKIGITAEKSVYLKKVHQTLEKIFPDGLETIEQSAIEYNFIIKSTDGKTFELHLNGEKIVENVSGNVFYEMVESRIRLTVAEHAVGKVFLHAGVVAWKGRAIVIPARSFSGKTTLVAELLKKGAVYYSDEYAVLDADGYVQPFPKWLSIRGIVDEHTQTDCPVESLGGVAGTETIPVGMVLIAKYNAEKKAPKRWNPRVLSPGQAIMEILPHTIPIRNNPRFVLKVLNKLTNRAIIVKSVRGEAREFTDPLLNYFESKTF